jgi:hypothetical protein
LSFNLAQASQLQPELEAQQALEQALAEISTQRYERAEILLERVLMLQPENAEARIELALLMARRGHILGAQALVQSLLDDPRTEPAHAQALISLQNQIQKMPDAKRNPNAPDTREAAARLSGAASGAASGADHATAAEPNAASWRGEASLSASSNPLARTASGAITITLPDGPLSLPLSQTVKPGALAAATLSRTTATQGAELAVQQTDVLGTSTAARAVVWGQLPLAEWLPNSIKPGLLPPVLGYAQVQRGLDGQHRATAGLTAALGLQRLSLSHYKDYAINDNGTVVRAEHNQPSLWGTQWQASIEKSSSDSGPQGHWRAGLHAEYALGNGRKLLAQFSHQQDTYSYSALLQDGAKRRLTTAYFAWDQQMALGHEKVLVWRLFRGERRSNLALFDYHEVGAQLSVVHYWR